VKCIFPANDITSFIIPFIGPHECENVKKCPNQTFVLNDINELTVNKREKGHQFDIKKNRFSASKINELCSSSAYTHIYCDQKNDSASISASSSFQKDSQSIEIEKKCTSTSSTPCESQFSNLTTGKHVRCLVQPFGGRQRMLIKFKIVPLLDTRTGAL
jgi:hypothetical protein